MQLIIVECGGFATALNLACCHCQVLVAIDEGASAPQGLQPGGVLQPMAQQPTAMLAPAMSQLALQPGRLSCPCFALMLVHVSVRAGRLHRCSCWAVFAGVGEEMMAPMAGYAPAAAMPGMYYAAEYAMPGGSCEVYAWRGLVWCGHVVPCSPASQLHGCMGPEDRGMSWLWALTFVVRDTDPLTVPCCRHDGSPRPGRVW